MSTMTLAAAVPQIARRVSDLRYLRHLRLRWTVICGICGEVRSQGHPAGYI